MKIETIPIADIVPYENNAKIHTDRQIEQIAQSIREFGNNDPIAIDENNIIIEGHGRLLALQKLGYEKAEIIRLSHLTDEQRRAYTLIHNQLTMTTGFDLDILGVELAGIEGIDMGDFDFEMPDLGGGSEVQEDDFDVVLPDDPKAKAGEIYLLGRHRLMCGDATKREDMDALLAGAKADLLLTDPPYNVDYTGKTKKGLKIQNDKNNDSGFAAFLVSAFGCAVAMMKEGAVFYIWHADSEGYNFRKACFESGLQVRQCLIWNKNTMVMGRQDYHWKHEPCLYGWKDGASHLWASDRKQTTVLDFERPSRSLEHPTMKPVKLFDYQIQNNTKKEDVVLDPFGGSGTSLIACEQNGRIAYMMELDPRYIDVIIARWEALTNQKAVKIN